MKKVILLILTITLPTILICQVNFENTYGGIFDETSHSILQTDDNGFLLCGHTSSYGNGLSDTYVVKTDSLGNLEWENTYGGLYDDQAYFITGTNDGGYIICGGTTSFGPRKAFLLKINSTGDSLWTNHYVYPGYYMSWARYILPTEDNGFLVCGASGDTELGETDAFLFKVDENGQLLWSKIYGGNDYDNAFSMCNTHEGGYLLIGSTKSFGVENFDLYLIKTNSAGDTLWTKTYGGAGYDGGRSIRKLEDGNYVLGVQSPNFGANTINMTVLKIDNNGNIIWSSNVGDDIQHFGCFISLTSDNNIVGCGWNHDYYTSTDDLVMFKMDTNGELLWSQKYGGPDIESGLNIIETSDFGLAITGVTFSYGAGMSDMYLVKTNSEGLLTSINNQNIKSDHFKIYPNPCSNKFTIKEIREFQQIELIGLDGKRYKSFNVPNNYQDLNQFDVSGFSRGIYLVKIKCYDSYYYEKLIIK